MFKQWTDNPIYTRLAKKNSPFVKPALWLIGIVGITGLTVSWLNFRAMYIHASGRWNILSHVANLGLVLLLITPLIVALTAVVLTCKDINGETYHLVTLTGLTQENIAGGYLLTAFRRLWLLLALAVALAPTVVLGSYEYTVAQFNYGQSTFEDILNKSMVTGIPLISLAIGCLALNVILGYVGVKIALALKKTVAAIAASIGVMFAILMIEPFIAIILFFITTSLFERNIQAAYIAFLVSFAGMFMVLPVAFACVMLDLIREKPGVLDTTDFNRQQQGPDHVQTLDR